ncbi:MAG TPA: DUF1565 domain-containing protein, partial [Bacteroidales bacterium]|nr:DUF1565 domain-containing protein [Bacteroidales bacterium]
MKPKLKLPKAQLVCAVFLFFVTSIFATNIYVKPTGSNTADGLSVANAKKDISVALLLANAGDTIFVAPGIYRDLIKPQKSGTVSNPITLIADTISKIFTSIAPGPAIIDGADSSFNFNMDISNVSYITIKGFTFQNARIHCIRINSAIADIKGINISDCKFVTTPIMIENPAISINFSSNVG